MNTLYCLDGCVRAEALAPVERAQASRAYAAGQYLSMEGLLFRATAAISVGDALEEGTNLVRTTVAAELEAIRALLS